MQSGKRETLCASEKLPQLTGRKLTGEKSERGRLSRYFRDTFDTEYARDACARLLSNVSSNGLYEC